ncbi:hypothetical protein BH20ACT2_BH20ACT2_20850 [soil metagenome]
MPEAVLTGWYVGFAIALVVITLIVVLVGIILGLARRIGTQATKIEQALDESRVNTLPLWDVAIVNDSLGDIVRDATAARNALEQS